MQTLLLLSALAVGAPDAPKKDETVERYGKVKTVDAKARTIVVKWDDGGEDALKVPVDKGINIAARSDNRLGFVTFPAKFTDIKAGNPVRVLYRSPSMRVRGLLIHPPPKPKRRFR